MTLLTTVIAGIDKAFEVTSTLTGDMTLRKVTSIFDPSTGDVSESLLDYTVKGVFDDSEESGLADSDIQQGVRVAWIQSKEVEPRLDDTLIGPPDVDTGSKYTITSVEPISPYDTGLLYKLMIRA